jgi:hypothetical protein
MELLDKYMDLVINHVYAGVYQLKVDPNQWTYEDAAMLMENWVEKFGDKRILIITAGEEDLEYREHFDFMTAMKLLKNGYTVGRRSEDFYLFIDPVSECIMEQVMSPYHEPTTYVIDKEDLEAFDWMIIMDDRRLLHQNWVNQHAYRETNRHASG